MVFLGKGTYVTGIMMCSTNRHPCIECCQPNPLLNKMTINKTVQRRRVRDDMGNEVEGVAAVSFRSFTGFSVNIGRACKVVSSIPAN
jgi:hypothetical protein